LPATGFCCRQRPRQALRSLFRADGQAQEGLRDEQQQQQQQEPGFLLGLSDFLDSVGSGMAALGLFAQVMPPHPHSHPHP
jgi:hypothetical protein